MEAKGGAIDVQKIQGNPPNFLFEAGPREAFIPAEVATRRLGKNYPMVLLYLGANRQVCWPNRNQIVLAEQTADKDSLLCFVRCRIVARDGGTVRVNFLGRHSKASEPQTRTLTLEAHMVLYPVSLR